VVTPDDLVRRRARQLAAQAAASGDPAGWFETLYAEARDGQAVVPWDDGEPTPHLTQWAATAAIQTLAGLVAPGGTLLVIARATDEQDPVRDPALMPWPLTRRELQAMAGRTLTAGPVEQFLDAEDPPKLRWRAQFTRR
jgi:hypothetical protein